jgi:ribulose-5-phosphate 4-epimerase/fuculose-1-phosphate aldolase
MNLLGTEINDDSGVSAEQWRARVDLAALYRLFDHFGWTDLTYTHISARLPGESEIILINRYGLLFEEVTASTLVTVDFDGHSQGDALSYNQVGHLIHSAVMRARREVNFVLHSHTRAGAAVSAMTCGLLPLSEHANVVLGTLAYHPYGVVKEGSQECERLVRDLGDSSAMILRNHGLLVCGRTAAEAFLFHYFLEMACRIQVDVLRSGQAWIKPPEEAVAELSAWGAPRGKPWGDRQWAALLRLLERKAPDYRS